jgi:hypothetical protein
VLAIYNSRIGRLVVSAEATVLRGVIHGKTIQLDQAPGWPEGQEVKVTLELMNPAEHESRLPPGQGLRRAFGAWAEEAEQLDMFLEEIRVARKCPRRELEPRASSWILTYVRHS